MALSTGEKYIQNQPSDQLEQPVLNTPVGFLDNDSSDEEYFDCVDGRSSEEIKKYPQIQETALNVDDVVRSTEHLNEPTPRVVLEHRENDVLNTVSEGQSDQLEKFVSTAAGSLTNNNSSDEEYFDCVSNVLPEEDEHLQILRMELLIDETQSRSPGHLIKPTPRVVQNNVEKRENCVLKTNQDNYTNRKVYKPSSGCDGCQPNPVHEDILSAVDDYLCCKRNKAEVPLPILEAAASQLVDMEKKDQLTRLKLDSMLQYLNKSQSPILLLYKDIANDYRKFGHYWQALTYCYKAYTQVEFKLRKTETDDIELFYSSLITSLKESCNMSFEEKLSHISELCDLVDLYMEEGRDACFIICNHLREMYHVMSSDCPLQDKHLINSGLKRVFTILAILFQKRDEWKTSIEICRIGLTQYCDFDDTKLLEMLAVAYSRIGRVDIALQKAQDALHYAVDKRDSERLQIFIVELKCNLRELEDKPFSESSEYYLHDLEYLKDEDNGESNVVENKRKRRRKRKQKLPRSSSSQEMLDNCSVSSMVSYSTTATEADNCCIDQQVYPLFNEKDDDVYKECMLENFVNDCQNQITQPAAFNQKNELNLSDSTDLDTDMDERLGVDGHGQFQFEQENETTVGNDENLYEQSKHIHLESGEIDDIYHRISSGDFELKEADLDKYINVNPKRTSTFDSYYDRSLNEEQLKDCLRQDPNKYIHCTVNIKSAHLALCEPVIRCHIEEIEIYGRNRCGHNVFNHDEVVVEIIERNRHISIQQPRHTEQKQIVYGKVLGSLNNQPRKEHPIFVCNIDTKASHLMKPLCKTIPKINVFHKKVMENFPEQSRRYKVEIWGLGRNGDLCFQHYCDVNPAVPFEYLFRVIYINWSEHYCYPQGAVIEAIPCNTSFFMGDLILRMQNNVPYLYSKGAVIETERTQVESKHDGMYRLRKDISNLETFTIDNETSKDLDDALSFEEFPDGTSRVGVHIADVASTVLKGTNLDKEAFSRVQSFYPLNKQPIHMLPNPVVEQCSLLPGEKRRTISVFLTYDKDHRNSCALRKPEIFCSTICSSRRLTYSDVQNVIDEGKMDSFSIKLQKLSSIARLLKKKRLGNASNAMVFKDAFFQLDDAHSESEEAHQLVEEFMIEANCHIAKFVKNQFPSCVPLRIQNFPDQELIQNFVRHFGKSTINLVVKLQNRVLNDHISISVKEIERKDGSVKIPVIDTVWKALREAAEENKWAELKKLIFTDGIHPVQQLVVKNWMSLLNSTNYRCSGELHLPNRAKHFDLNVGEYTHFTSPIRRYIDLVIQRLVHATLKRDACPYTTEEISQICKSVTSGSRRARSYENKICLNKIAEKLRKHPYSTYAIVKEITDEGLLLSVPSLSQMGVELSFSSLGIKTVPCNSGERMTSFIQCEEFVRVKWRKAIYDCKGCPSLLMSQNRRGKNQELKVDPLCHSVSVPLKEWASLVEPFLSRKEDKMANVRMLLDKPNEHSTHMRSMQTVKDVSSEINKEVDGTWNNFSCIFSQSYMIGQVIKLQLSAALKEAMLVPSAQLFSVAPSYKCCIQHVSDPVNCFATYNASPTSYSYSSFKKYLETWLPLTLMESASESVQGEDNVLINNVETLFRYSRNKAVEGEIVLQINFCEERNIQFGGQSVDQIGSKDDDDLKCTSLASVDFLCIRVNVDRNMSSNILAEQQFTWIGHGQIYSARKKEKTNELFACFKLKNNLQQIPEDLFGKKVCSVEIIPKSESLRREEYYLKMATSKEYGSNLGRTLACSMDNIPALESSHLEHGRLIDKDISSGIKDKPLPRNNSNQLYAIGQALTTSVTLIQGPPGTGKTYTGLKLICLYNKINDQLRMEGGKKKQVLFCGPSNTSVDVMAKILLERIDESRQPKILRIHGKTEVCKDFPIPKRDLSKLNSARLYKADDKIKRISLHHIIRLKGKPYAKDLLGFDVKFKKHPDTVTNEEIKQYNKLIALAEKDEIPKYNILFCTCSVAGNRRLVASSSVYQCIVDESGMCTEPQTLAPIIAHQAKQVVLIGDHKQLRPILNCQEAAELGMERSLFERYSDNALFLNTQYRMHPKICDFPSKTFYENRLYTASSPYWKDDFPLKLWPNKDCPHLFIHVEGEEDTLTVTTAQGNEKSKSNKKEISEVVRIFKLMVEKERKKPEYMMILSQYKSQCNEIKKALDKENLPNKNVSTVVSSQGGEWDYVIISTVRSLPHYKIAPRPTLGWCKPNLGCTADPHQMNVAVTRARKGLIIVGNKYLLRCDKNWKQLLEDYETKGCVKTPNDIPNPSVVYYDPVIPPRFQNKKN